MEQPEPSKVERSPKAREAAKFLGRRMKIGVVDGRTLVGTFNCIDKQGNIILINTLECRAGGIRGEQPPPERPMGLVLVPAEYRTSCELQVGLAEQMDALKL